jgi:hypothetical protein
MPTQLRVPFSLYQQRRDRLRRLIEIDAPLALIALEVRSVARCFRWTIMDRLRDWYYRRAPLWLLWITSSDYRGVCRDMEDSVLISEDEDD